MELAVSCGIATNGLFIMARVRGHDGNFVIQSTLSSIAWKTIDRDAPTVIVASGTLTIADVIFNTLQTHALDPRWPASAPASGYNLGAQIPASGYPLGDKRYITQLDLTPVVGDLITLQSEHQTHPHYPTS